MIRLARSEDIQTINDIYNQAVHIKFQTADLVPWDPVQRSQWWEKHDASRYPVCVFEIEEIVVGWASLSPYREQRKALINTVEVSFYLDHQHTGQGIGSKLLEEMIHRAKAVGYHNMISLLLSQNHASIALLKKFEFDEWGRMPNLAEIESEKCDHLYYGRSILE